LLCRGDVQLDWRSQAARVRRLYVASPAAAEGTVDLAAKSEAKFKLPGGTLTTQTPLLKSALSVLIERWPQVLHFDELLDESMRRINIDPAASQAQREQFATFLSDNLILCQAQRAVMLYTAPPPIASQPSERPQAFAVARQQAQKDGRVTSLLHELVQLSDFDRQLIRQLDGSRTQKDILDKLAADVKSGALKPSAGVSSDPGQLQAALQKTLADSLTRFARLSLLQV
jgi:methyltransferase-like protein